MAGAGDWRLVDAWARAAEGDTPPFLVPLGDGVAVPARFTARLTNGRRIVTVHVRVVTGARGQPDAEITGVEIARSGDRAVSPADPSGLPWGTLFDMAVAAGASFGLARAETPDGSWPPAEPSAFVAFADPEAVERAARRLRRRSGRRLTPEHLALVREVAGANPTRPEAAVAETWGVARTTAQYWLARARARTEDQQDNGRRGAKRTRPEGKDER
jgi:hypothetical protein